MHSLRMSIPSRGVYYENLEIETEILFLSIQRTEVCTVCWDGMVLCIWEASVCMERGVQLGWIGYTEVVVEMPVCVHEIRFLWIMLACVCSVTQ